MVAMAIINIATPIKKAVNAINSALFSHIMGVTHPHIYLDLNEVSAGDHKPYGYSHFHAFQDLI